MANSLQEQLLKAGLVTEADLNRSKKKEHKARKRSGGKRANNQLRAEVDRARDQKAERDKALNDAREAERRERELRTQVRELILSQSLNEEKSDVAYNMVKNGRIRRIYVTAAQRDGLANGTFAVTSARGRHHVVPNEVAMRIRELLPQYFVFHVNDVDSASDEPIDDEYAQFKVPDDLTW